MRLHGTLRCGLRQAGIFRFAVLLLPSVYASGGHPGMPYARQNSEKCGLALVRQGEKSEKAEHLGNVRLVTPTYYKRAGS